MARFKLMVLSKPVDGREDEYNAWYSGRHLADVLRVPGVIAAQRFRLGPWQIDGLPQPWPYLAIYDCDAEGADEVAAALTARAGTSEMPMSSALAAEQYAAYFEPITEPLARAP